MSDGEVHQMAKRAQDEDERETVRCPTCGDPMLAYAYHPACRNQERIEREQFWGSILLLALLVTVIAVGIVLLVT